MVRTSILPQVFPLEMSGLEEAAVAMVESVGTLEAPSVPAAILPVAHPVEGHLEAEAKEVLSFGYLEVSEMQDETQEDAATSSPDPLTLAGPADRDIDDSQPLLDSAADSFVA